MTPPSTHPQSTLRPNGTARLLSLLLVAAVSAAALQSARSAVIVEEYFNYGATGSNLSGLGTGADPGWSAAWTGHSGPDYAPTADITYSDPNGNYDNSLNPSTGGGANTSASGSAAGQVTSRTLDDPITTDFWTSVLITTTAADGEALLWFSYGAGSNSYISIRAGVARVLYNADSTTGQVSGFSAGTYLLLANIRMNVNIDGHDEIRLWVNPNLSNFEASLGTPTISRTGANALGASVVNVGVSFQNPRSQIDAIRLGDTIHDVIPEPSATALVLLGGCAFLVRRSRRA